MLSHDKELEIRRQFLDEAQDYLDTLDRTLLGAPSLEEPSGSTRRLDAQTLNAALRIAHSLKGGAAMMGFKVLSDLSHRLEDALKVFKVASPAIAPELESLLLLAVNCLHRVIDSERQDLLIDQQWLSTEVEPVFEALQAALQAASGASMEETAASVLLPEDGQDVVPMIFETEVEGCLQRLEAVLATPEQLSLREEVTILAQELGSLGEMLQLSAFTQLCASIESTIAQTDDDFNLAHQALNAWRYAQALVLTGQSDRIPTDLADRSDALPNPFTESLDHPPTHASIEPSDNSFVDALPEVLSETSSLASAPPPRIVPSTPDSTVRVSVRQLNSLNDLLGELTIDRHGLNLYLKRLRSLVRTLRQRMFLLQQVNGQLRTVYDRATLPNLNRDSPLLAPMDSAFDSLELDRYGEMHSLSQQVMETIVQLQEVTDDVALSLDDTDQAARNLNKTAKHLHTGLNRLRMRPFSDLVESFPRALRDWSAQYGKSVQLNITGGDLRIDRSILESLQDPLLHLLRNAFDHGIEDPETRALAGKSLDGTIEIQAIQQGNRTVITVQDDGRGIALQKIRDRAEQLGLDPTLLANASETELLSLIFEPGFTTHDRVTALSGRGIGMDVVRSNLKQVRGEISVDTQLGQGTTFTLTVPLTLLSARILLVETHNTLLALPTDLIAEIALFQSQAVRHTANGLEFVHRGGLIPIVPLDRWLVFRAPQAPHSFETPATIDRTSVLILHHNQQLVGLFVDRCWSEQEATVRPVEGTLNLPAGLSGCTILGDGRVVPLVNVSELMHWVASYHPVSYGASAGILSSGPLSLPARLAAARPSAPLAAPTVLIVDDSINVRRFLALTLERAGYRVEQAKDGQEAIDRLTQNQGIPVKAVICDIEMPRLDGYGLLTQIKEHPDLADLPVALLSSRSGEKHRQLAMHLGASAYFSKPYNEQTLLRSLNQLIQTSHR